MAQLRKRCTLVSGENERMKKQNRQKAQRTSHKTRRKLKASNASEVSGVSGASGNRRLDPVLKFSYPKAVVHHNYSCTLLHVDMAKNKNEFYVMQLARLGKEFLFYTRWGKVGVQGQHNIDLLTNGEEAIRIFEQTFTSKTKTTWVGRRHCQYHKHRYSLLEIDDKARDEDTDSKLNPRTKRLIRHICSDDRIIKMPLGTVGKKQAQRALHVLDEIEKAIKKEKTRIALQNLSSKFFTFIPQEKEIREIPNLFCVEMWREKVSTLLEMNISSDSLQERYEGLDCDLTHIDRGSEEFRLIKECADGRCRRLTDVWRVDRKGESERFSLHKRISERKLLWHGTRVPNVAPILKQGLRILWHSGGSFGAGIYFASDFSKSVSYVRREDFQDEKFVGYMFLVEVALGKMFNTGSWNGALRSAPKGYDAVVGRGRTEPDPEKDEVLKFDGKRVVFPCGGPVHQEEWASSCMNASEYLIYKESQARLRYVLRFSQRV